MKIFGSKISNIFWFFKKYWIFRNFRNFRAENFHRSKNIFQKTIFTDFFNFRKIHECSFPISYWTPPNSFWSRRTSNLNSQIPKSAVGPPRTNFATNNSTVYLYWGGRTEIWAKPRTSRSWISKMRKAIANPPKTSRGNWLKYMYTNFRVHLSIACNFNTSKVKKKQ